MNSRYGRASEMHGEEGRAAGGNSKGRRMAAARRTLWAAQFFGLEFLRLAEHQSVMLRLYAHLCRRAETTQQLGELGTFQDKLLGADYDAAEDIFNQTRGTDET